MTATRLTYPFSAIVGQDTLKRALLLNAICPALGGVLIVGERGTAKSTAARALAALLPPIRVVRGCRYRCDPNDEQHSCPQPCDLSRDSHDESSAPFVELPLGATEDRVVGSLDLEQTLHHRRPVLRPGLLAAAHRGILYIDEINLLADHLVDLLLDAAASGYHCVEREGISLTQQSQFVLVGTMNPDQGQLRPQLADRFGVMVNVATPTDPTERAEVVRRRLAYDSDPVGFCAAWTDPEAALRRAIAAARQRYATVSLNHEQLTQIARVCVEHGVEGLRADLALGRAARALAAWAGRDFVASEDLQSACELVLPHRQRSPRAARSAGSASASASAPAMPPPTTRPTSESSDFSNTAVADSIETTGESSNSLFAPPVVAPPVVVAPPEHLPAPPRWPMSTHTPTPANNTPRRDRPLPDTVPTRQTTNANPEHRPGSTTRTTVEGVRQHVALDATLRAAALRHASTTSPADTLSVQPDDLRLRKRRPTTKRLVLFVVDASGSMGARRRMELVKGVVLARLADSRRQRDEIAVVVVRGPRAELLLPPTDDIRQAQDALARLPTGGRTPLAHGLTLAADLARQRYGSVWLLVVSDGRANVPLPGSEADPWQQALAACGPLAQACASALVIDAHDGHFQSSRAGELARALGAVCWPLAQLGTLASTDPPVANVLDPLAPTTLADVNSDKG